MASIWGQFNKRYLSHQSLKLVWKLLNYLFFKSPRGQWVNWFTLHCVVTSSVNIEIIHCDVQISPHAPCSIRSKTKHWAWAKCIYTAPDSKVHGAHLGPTGSRWAPFGPHEQGPVLCSVLLGLLVISHNRWWVAINIPMALCTRRMCCMWHLPICCYHACNENPSVCHYQWPISRNYVYNVVDIEYLHLIFCSRPCKNIFRFHLFYMNITYPDNKIHGTNIGPAWALSAPNGPHVGPMNLAIRNVIICVK